MDGFEDPASVPDNVIIARAGQAITLSFDCEDPVWYTCDGLDGSNAKTAGIGKQFTVSPFSGPGLLYFRCEGSDGKSRIFAVGCTGLPQLNIDTSGNEIKSKVTYTDSLISLYDSDGSVIEENTPVLIRGRGNSTWFSSMKKGYKLKFDSKRKLLGLSKSKTWPLIPNAYDYTLLGNYFAGYVRNEVFNTGWNPDYVLCDVVMNGVFLGTYAVAEGIKISSSRVDIQGLDELEKDLNGDGKTDINDGGFILEIGVKRDGEIQFNTGHGVCVAMIEPSVEDIDELRIRDVEYYVKDKINRLENAVYGASGEDYSDLLDLDSFVDWYLTNEFFANTDASLHMSTYMYYDPSDGKFHMGPCWDFDHYATRNRDEVSVDVPRALWVHELLQFDEVREQVRERWNEKKTDLYNAINSKFPEFATETEIAGIMNSYRWNNNVNYRELVGDRQNLLAERYSFLDSYFNEFYK